MSLFVALETQWRVSIDGCGTLIYMGLSYPAVESVMRIWKVKRRRDLFDGIRVMESAALKVLNGKRSVGTWPEHNVKGQQGDDQEDGRVGREQKNGAA